MILRGPYKDANRTGLEIRKMVQDRIESVWGTIWIDDDDDDEGA
jgi:hypothetical protein